MLIYFGQSDLLVSELFCRKWFSRCEKIRCVSSVFLTIVEGDQNIKYKIFLLLYSVRNSCTTSLFWPLSATAEPLSYCGQTCKSNLDSTLNDAKVLGLSNVFIHCLSELKRFLIQNIIKVYFISSCHYWPEVIKQH